MIRIAAAALVLAACDASAGEARPAPAASTESGPPSADATLVPGARLYDAQGKLWGIVMEVSRAHRFADGVVEPGVLVDHGPRMDDPRPAPRWHPRRAAERFQVQ